MPEAFVRTTTNASLAFALHRPEQEPARHLTLSLKTEHAQTKENAARQHLSAFKAPAEGSTWEWVKPVPTRANAKSPSVKGDNANLPEA